MAKRVLGNQLRITYPDKGSTGAPVVEVHGFTPFRDGAHYLVVSVPGGDFIQDGPLKVSPTGLWSGFANLGNPSAGPGIVFSVRVFYTREPLPAGSQAPCGRTRFSQSPFPCFERSECRVHVSLVLALPLGSRVGAGPEAAGACDATGE